MVAFTAAQLDSFFQNGPQMSLSPEVRARLANEGLTNTNDFADFKADQLSDSFKNMRTAIPGVAVIPEL